MLKARITIPNFAGLLPTREQVIALGVATVNTVLDQVEKDYAATYRTFTHKPKFVKEKAKLVGSVVIGAEYTEDENYARLNDGTRDHMVGRNRQLMSYHRNYRSKTHQYPHSAQSVGGGPSGPKIVARGPWRVRGIQPRLFEVVVSQHAQHQLETNARKLEELLR